MKDFEVEWSREKFDRLRLRASNASIAPFHHEWGWSHGCDPTYLKFFLDFWVEEFCFDDCLLELNRFPQVVAHIEGIDIHAIHVVGEAKGKNPLLLLHGWPGSVYEFWNVIEPLAYPSRFGGKQSDAFDLVVPSLPGFGFSGKSASPTGARTAARIMHGLMQQLGYERYLAQGGDWGSGIAAWLGIDFKASLAGIHLNYLLVQPDTQPETPDEREWKSSVERAQQELGAYSHLQQTKPASLAYAIHDNPTAQAAWILERFYDCSDRRERDFEAILSKKRLLTNILIYLMNDAFTSATYFYLGSRIESVRTMPTGQKVHVPTAMTLYPDPRIPAAPKSWVQKGYNLKRWTIAPKGGHFAAMEVSSYFVEDLRAWLGDLRA